MRKRLTVLCHVWPGITPWSVWRMEWRDWLMFAHAADEWVEARKEACDRG